MVVLLCLKQMDLLNTLRVLAAKRRPHWLVASMGGAFRYMVEYCVGGGVSCCKCGQSF